MTFKNARLAAYGVAAIIATSGIGMEASAASLFEVLPAAGIGLTLSDGTALSQIREKANKDTLTLTKLTKMVQIDQSVLKKSNLVSSSVLKDVLPVKEKVDLTDYASVASKKEEVTITSVIGMTASADEEQVFTDVLPVTVYGQTAADAQRLSDALIVGREKDAPEQSGEVAGVVRPLETAEEGEQNVVNENTASLIENVLSEKENEKEDSSEDNSADEKVIETTQTAQEVAAIIEQSLKEQLEAEEKEFSKLVIAKVDHYVNVRSLPDETSEIVGKLYDQSVGTYVSEQNGWYEINSGNVSGFVKAEFCVTGQDAVALARQVGIRIATITADALRVREQASLDAAVLGRVPQGDELIVIEEGDEWVKVSIEEGDGWISKEFVELRTDFVKAESKEEEKARLAKEEAARKAAKEAAAAKLRAKESNNENKNYKAASTYVQQGEGSASGNAVAQFALQFVGNPYVYGGSSLTNGTDCSGFVMSVYNNFGVSLPHSSSADRNVGSAVGSLEEAQPGDIVCYSGHVGLYIGGGQIVHASTRKTGIIVSNASYKKILSIRRIF